MKQINHLFHFTRHFETLVDILSNGLKASYTEEVFGNRKILIPIISFSNILLRDVGGTEVVFYGSYGIGVTRQFGIESGLNPVCYVYDNSSIDKVIREIQFLNLVPQFLDFLKERIIDKGMNVQDVMRFNPPQPPEVMNLLENIKPDTSNALVNSISDFSEKIFNSVHELLLLAKPYKVSTPKGEMIAYNEREWRKTYPEMRYYFEKDVKGNINKDYQEMKAKKKPHFTEYPYILEIHLDKLSFIIVEKEEEIEAVKNILINKYGDDKVQTALTETLKIDIISNLMKLE